MRERNQGRLPRPTCQMIWVQMRACNTHGKSPWSDPATIRVP